jgi:hypothetical protein
MASCRAQRVSRSQPIAALVLASCLLVSSAALAQIGASVEGVVQDQSGGAVGNATVSITNTDTGQARETATDAAGRYQIFGLGPGERYEIRAQANGFRPDVRVLASVIAGERRVQDFQLAVGAVTDRVDVRPELPLARTGTPALGGTLREAQVQELPVNGRDLVSLAYLIPGAAPARGFYNLAPKLTINGSSSLITNYTVDGYDNTDLFLGGPKVPVAVSSTQNLTVMVNSYSAEYGRTGNGVFAVTTRSGGQQHAGELFYYVRPGASLDSPNYFAPKDANGEVIDDSFQRHHFGASAGGPLSPGTFYFANVEITRESQDAILTSPLSVGLAPTSFHNHALMGKVDRQWNASQLSSFRYLFADYTHHDDIGFVGGLTLPTAGLQVNYQNNFASWNHRSVLSNNSLNEVGVMVGRMRADWRTLDAGPRVVVTDRGATLAVIGGVSDNFLWTETDFQLRNVYTRVAGRHTLKAGGDLLSAQFDIRSGPGARGAYTVDLEGRQIRPAGEFLEIGDIPRDVRVLSYSQSFVNPEATETQNLLAFFVEDAVRVRPDVVLTGGLRWDYDSVTNTPEGGADLNNLAPRLGVAWSPGGDTRHQVRAGYGLFFERIPFAVFSDTIFNSPDGGSIAVTFAPGTAFAPPAFPSQLPRDAYQGVPINQLPPRNVQVFDPALKSPRNQQLSIGYARELTADFAVSVDYINNKGSHLIRRVDTNAPASIPAGIPRSVAAADATRPIVPVAGGFRLIEQDESTGSSQFHGLYLSARKRFSNSFAFDLAYTLSKIENDTDDINFRPVDSRRADDEFGASLNDRLHVFALNGHVRLPLEIDVMPILFLSSGQPLNVVTGGDDNGDTIFNDRPAGVGRNTERTSGYRQLDLGIIRRFRVGAVNLEARAEIFNLLDTTNYSGFFNFGASGVRPDESGTLAFQPTVAGPPRQFQFAARLTF